MNMRKLPFITGALLLSAAAFAGDDQYAADLSQPVSAAIKLIANGNVWACSASRCVLASNPEDVASIRTCRELRRQVGTLASYGSGKKPFDADQLARCNAK
jgi:hypothetical protein